MTITTRLADRELVPGDVFDFSLEVTNHRDAGQVDVYCLLAVPLAGNLAYYFWPGWTTELDGKHNQTMVAGDNLIDRVIFDWPTGAGTSTESLELIAGLFLVNRLDTASLLTFDSVKFTYSEPLPPSPTPIISPSPTPVEFEFMFQPNDPISDFCLDDSRPEDCSYCFSVQHGGSSVIEIIGSLELIVPYPIDVLITVSGEAFDLAPYQANPVRLTPAIPSVNITLRFYSEVPIYEWKTGTVHFQSPGSEREYSLCGYFSWF